MNPEQSQQVIDLAEIARTLWSKRRTFLKVWIATFVLACIWIFPQPRYYSSSVKLAPEMSGDQSLSGFASLASSFGINVGGSGGADAIYPELYPELFENPEFIVGLLPVQVTTKDGSLTTDYFTYMKKHQKKNMLTRPFFLAKKALKDIFSEEDKTPRVADARQVNPFRMNQKDFDLVQKIMDKVRCSVDKKTYTITISVQDQDPLICATMADSVKQHLQDFIIQYRTSKAVEDVLHYEHLRDSAEQDYNEAMDRYSRFCDAHRDIVMQSFLSQKNKLESELTLRQNSLSVMETQLTQAKVRQQEKTPAFTTLKSATVPPLPAGPKRLMFVIMMLILSSIATAGWLARKEILGMKDTKEAA